MLSSGHLLTGMTLGEKMEEGKDYGHEDHLGKNGARVVWLTQTIEPVTLDLRALGSSLTLGVGDSIMNE